MENSGTNASTLDKKWSSSGWNGRFYWYRTIGRCGKTWFQCGISANDRTPSSGKPSHFFTCKLMPRVGYTEQKIMKACEETAKALKFHRGPTGGRCDSCDSRNVQEVCTLGKYSMSRSQFRMMMDKHDKMCSCGCFDVGCHAISITETSTSKLALGQNLELSDDLSAEKWTFVPEESSPAKAYWTRIVKNGDETWNQYGVSKDHQTPHDDQPDFSFTCKVIPREGKSEQYIRPLAEEERMEPPPYAVQQPGRSAFQNEHFYKHSPVMERKPHEHCDPFSSSNEDWTFHKRHVGSVPGAHLTRAIKRNNKIYYQYGVGKQKRLTPDFWFTWSLPSH
ncbi:hypothetical protein JADG_009829 [Aureobasidium aubasidani]|nr:hypothetical protein JADG_009829 [Aureobasidium pullulans]